MKIKKAIEFLKERYNVKFFIKLKGREKMTKEEKDKLKAKIKVRKSKQI